MSSQLRLKQELHELVSLMQSKQISEEQLGKLDDLLSSNKAAREIYYDIVGIDLLLHHRNSSFMPLAIQPAEAQESKRYFPLISNAWTHIAAISATAALVLCSQYYGYTNDSNSTQPRYTANNGSNPLKMYTATVVQEVDCVWGDKEHPIYVGQRLSNEELVLNRGVAEIRFDSGVTIVIEAPSQISIESPSSALLTSGKVVLKGGEAEITFSLHTPTATLIDIGTEYGVSVGPTGKTEVHVFEGEVAAALRIGNSEKKIAQHLTEGQAGVIDVSGTSLIKISDHFVRDVLMDKNVSLDAKASRHTNESFDYPAAALGNLDGGSGWQGPWREYIGQSSPSTAKVRHEATLGSEACLELQGHEDTSWRTLKEPIRLDVDAVYYLSFQMLKETEAQRGLSQYGAVALRPATYPKDQDQLSFGMSSERNLVVTHNDQQMLTAPPLPMNETVQFVVKIVAGEKAPDQLMVRWYGPNESIAESEPHTWSSVSQPAYSDTVYSELSIRSIGEVKYLFDNIRIGYRWSSITN